MLASIQKANNSGGKGRALLGRYTYMVEGEVQGIWGRHKAWGEECPEVGRAVEL